MGFSRMKQVLLLAVALWLAACSSQPSGPNAVDARPAIQLFLIGDGTLAQTRPDQAPETGWGMVLGDFAKPELRVRNFAARGHSSKSFRQAGYWHLALEQLRPGDHVLIQFGHNDQRADDASRFTAPVPEFADNLRGFVQDVKDHGAHPLLVTPACRRHFDDAGRLRDTHGDYPAVMRELASNLQVPLVDMQAVTWNSLQELGPVHSTSLYMHLEPGQHPNYPRGKADDTHFSRHGALWATHLFLQQLRGLEHPLAAYFYGS